MAVRNAVLVAQALDTKVYEWSELANTDTGEPITLHGRTDLSVQLTGTLGTGGTCTIEGTNDPGASPVFAALNDPNGNALALNALKIEQVLEAPLKIRPNITAGDGATALTVRATCVRKPT